MRLQIETTADGDSEDESVPMVGESRPANIDKSKRNRERGQSLVELALVTPLLCIVLFAIVEFGFVVYYQIELNHAASDGARIAAQGDTSTLQTRAQTEATTYLTDLAHCSSPTATASYDEGIPDTAELQVSCTYQPVTPLGILVGLVHGTLSTTPTLTGTAYQRVQ